MPVSVVGASAGPVITRFEVDPAVGVRGAQVVGLVKDLARALGVTSIRVVETIPGKTCMGLELPNPKRQMIRLSGLRPDHDIQIRFTGLRPGEKLYEELLHDSERPIPTDRNGILLAAPRAGLTSRNRGSRQVSSRCSKSRAAAASPSAWSRTRRRPVRRPTAGANSSSTCRAARCLRGCRRR